MIWLSFSRLKEEFLECAMLFAVFVRTIFGLEAVIEIGAEGDIPCEGGFGAAFALIILGKM